MKKPLTDYNKNFYLTRLERLEKTVEELKRHRHTSTNFEISEPIIDDFP